MMNRCLPVLVGYLVHVQMMRLEVSVHHLQVERSFAPAKIQMVQRISSSTALLQEDSGQVAPFPSRQNFQRPDSCRFINLQQIRQSPMATAAITLKAFLMVSLRIRIVLITLLFFLWMQTVTASHMN